MDSKKLKIPSFRLLEATFKFLNLPYLQKWSIFGILIGLIAGFSAVGVSFLTIVFTSIFLGGGAGFIPPSPGLTQNSTYASLTVERPWILPIITGLGGLAVGLLFYKIQTKGEGHGTDAVIDAFHNRQGNIQTRTPFLTALSSPITIGTGGSGGLEGPMSQIGAGFSSILGRLFKFDADDRRIAIAAGLAAGVGSIFKIPLGAALFSTEVFYRQDFEVKALVPSVIAAVSGYTVVGFITGWTPIFALPPDAAKYSHPESLLLYGIIGIISAAASMAYVRAFQFASITFAKLRVPTYFKPAIGGAAVGSLAIIAPHILGNSYGWLQLAMLSSPLLLPIWIILGIVILKIIATVLTIGSGGSAGVFAPTMAIGGLLGAFVGGLFHTFGLFLWIDVSATAIVGMVAFFCATAKTPIATIVMGSEMTSGYGLLAPMMIATVVAYAASSLNSSIFKSQVNSRRESPVHRAEYVSSILREITVHDAMDGRFLSLSSNTLIKDAVDELKNKNGDMVFITHPQFDDRDRKETNDESPTNTFGRRLTKLRVASLEDLKRAESMKTLSDFSSSTGALVIRESESLYTAFNLLLSSGVENLAVMNEAENKILGKISFKEIAKTYHDSIHNDIADERH